MPGYVEDELRGYLECGLLCFGFARAVCMTCRTGFVVAFSCKGRGVCPSSSGRHMARDGRASYRSRHPAGARAAVGDLFPLAFAAFSHRPTPAVPNTFLPEIERLLLAAVGGTPDADIPRAARPRLGGISFLHRFGSATNHHVHLRALSDRRCLRAGCRRSSM